MIIGVAQVIGTKPILNLVFSSFDAPNLVAPPDSTFFFLSLIHDCKAPKGITDNKAALKTPEPTVLINSLRF